MLSEKDLEQLLANTEPLFKNIHHFTCTVSQIPCSSQRGASIAHVDLLEQTDDFVRELRNTACSWVFSKAKYAEIFAKEMSSRKQDMQSASANIERIVRDTFRPGAPQGQFGELLLFNLLQHFFRAPPILRKMPLTTNPKLERNGADAIHLGRKGDDYVVYLGEAKTYSSKYKFDSALNDSIKSIFNSHANFYNELGQYVYDDFIEEPLREVAYDIKNKSITSIKHELVCVVSYTETTSKSGPDVSAIRAAIEKAVIGRLTNFDSKHLAKHDASLVSRVHYILMPFWDLKKVLGSL